MPILSSSPELTAALVAATLAMGCTKPPAPAPRTIAMTIANTPAPAPARITSSCPDSLGWLERTTNLRYTEVADGHFGYSELHADFQRRSDNDTFQGVVTMTYRERPDSVPKATSRVMTLKHSEVTALLTAMRDGIRTPPQPTRGGLYVIDTSQSITIALDAIAPDADGVLHVQFYVDSGEREPHVWGIRGCETDPPLAARRAVHDAAEAFARRLDRDATIQRLMTP